MQVDVNGNTETRQTGWLWLQQGKDTGNSPDTQIYSSPLEPHIPSTSCAPHPRRHRAKDSQGLPTNRNSCRLCAYRSLSVP